MTSPLALPPTGAEAAEDFAFVWRWLLLGMATGGWAGFLVGGVGGRIAMFVLRLTSSDSVRGTQSDDGFTIGQLSGATVFLLAVTTVLGMVVGVALVCARSQMPGSAGAVLIVLAAGTLGASQIIKPNGVDFTRLAPLPLACAMFTLIPLGGAALTLWITARWSVWWWQNPRRTVLAALPLVLVVPTFFVSIPFIVVSLAIGGMALRVGRLRQALTNRIGTIVVMMLAGAILVAASVALVSDIAEIV